MASLKKTLAVLLYGAMVASALPAGSFAGVLAFDNNYQYEIDQTVIDNGIKKFNDSFINCGRDDVTFTGNEWYNELEPSRSIVCLRTYSICLMQRRRTRWLGTMRQASFAWT